MCSLVYFLKIIKIINLCGYIFKIVSLLNFFKQKKLLRKIKSGGMNLIQEEEKEQNKNLQIN